MSLSSLISSLENHGEKFPREKIASDRTIAWIREYGELAFVKENFDWHLTGSMMIANPERTKVLLMLHKKFGRWQQFGGHCDGEVDVKNVAFREFHEESGILIDPEIIWDIFMVDVHDISADSKWRKEHHHFDVMYLATIPEDTPFLRQESEVDDIRWFDIDTIDKFVEEDMIPRIHKIKNFS